MKRLRHIALVTSNQEKLVHFYKTAFEMKEVKGIGPARYMSDGYMNLAIIDLNTPGVKLKEGLYHFGFEVEDIETLRKELKEAKASSELESRPKNRDAEFRVFDPDGNAIDVASLGRWPI